MSTINYDGCDLTLRVANYDCDPVCLCILLDDEEEGPYGTVTVNLGWDSGNNTIMPKYCSFGDSNNSEDLIQVLTEKGIMKPYKRFGQPVTQQSGYCEYNLYEFDAEKLREYDPEGCAAYEAAYDEEFKKLQAQMNMDFFSVFGH